MAFFVPSWPSDLGRGPRLPDEGRAAGGPRSANADLYPPCAVNAEFRSAPGVALLLFAALFVA